MVLSAFVLIANVLGAGMIVPQLLRLRRLRSSAGVSATWIGISLAMNLWWVVYGVSQGLYGMVPVSVVASLLYATIATDLHRLDGPPSTQRVLRGAMAIAPVPLLFAIVGGWAAAGLVIGLIYAIQFTPATVAAFRTTNLAGVSGSTWVMALGEAAIWFVYGWTQGDIALLIGGAGGAIMSALIVLRIASLSGPSLRGAFARSGRRRRDRNESIPVSSPVGVGPPTR